MAESGGVEQRGLMALADFGGRHPTLALRSCCLGGLLFFFILPVAGLAWAAWLYSTSIGPYDDAKAAYHNAWPCLGAPVSPKCYQLESGELVSFYRLPGKAASWSDYLSLRLGDGVHDVNIHYSAGDPNVAYQDATGKVRIKVYRGLITTVYGTDGTGHETTDSPQLLSYTVGIPLAMGLICGAWIVIAILMWAIVAIRSPDAIKGLWNLRNDDSTPPRPSL